ncbi:cell adhesion molecule CEACAM6-like [Clarias gariepinus]
MDLHAVSCFLILLTCTGVCFGQELILPERINGTVGGDVLFTPLKIPDPRPTSCSWRFNGALIISAQPSGTSITDSYQGRAFFSTVTLALELRILTERDTGQYTLTVQTDKGNFTAQTSLQVLLPVSNVAIIPSKTELVEFNSTVSLVCSASGSFPSFIWLNGSSEVTAGERVQLTNSNSNLTITSVMRGDTGPYRCEASNSFSNAKSPPLSLTIYYGPENVRVTAAPAEPSYSSGSNLILTCSADSSPAAEFQWAVNGAELGEMGQELKLSNIQSSHSGNYTCMAHNKQSLRYATSEPISITGGILVEVAVHFLQEL